MRKLTVWLGVALSVVTGAAAASAADKLRIFEGDWQPVSDADIAVHPLKPEGYTESWYLMVQGEAGLWVFLHFGVTNMEPWSDGNGVVETTILRPGAKPRFIKSKFDDDEVKFSTKTLHLKMGDSFIRSQEGDWVIRIRQDGVELDLNVKPVVAGVRPGRTIYPDDEFYQLNIAGPRVAVTGTMSEGKKKTALNGPGYMDHSLQDYPAHKMADRLYSFRGFSQEDGVNFLVFFTPESLGKKPMATLVLTKGDKVIARATQVTLTGAEERHDKANKYTYPAAWTIKADDGGKPVTGTIKLGELLQSQNAADDFNMFERTLIKTFVANPMLYRHPGSFSFQVGDQTVSGDGVAEVVILRQ